MEYHEPRGELGFTITEEKSVSEIRFLTFDVLVLIVIYIWYMCEWMILKCHNSYIWIVDNCERYEMLKYIC